jgi:hypothetical protein
VLLLAGGLAIDVAAAVAAVAVAGIPARASASAATVPASHPRAFGLSDSDMVISSPVGANVKITEKTETL